MPEQPAITAAEQFRQTYRSAISSGYSGNVHAGTVFTLGILSCLYCYFNISQWNWTQTFILTFSLLFGNFGEYAIHRWLGHKKQWWAKLFYQRHTGDHHHFFVKGLMTCDNKKDWRVLFFPSWLIVAVIVFVALPVGALVEQVISEDAGFTWALGIISTYLIYEVAHFSYHLPHHHWVFKLPLMAQLRDRHIAHHDPQIMHRGYFNITLPIFDYLLQTGKPK